MDTAAISFIDELVSLTESGLYSDAYIKEKIERFTLDIILTCVMGDFNNDLQIS